jgi:L-fuconolactonase
VVELAKRENAVIKITGACTLSKEPYPFPDIRDPLFRMFDAWGFERCLWGTDRTRASSVAHNPLPAEGARYRRHCTRG